MSKEFIQINNYIIRKSEIVFIKTTRIKGEYYIHIEMDNLNIKMYYEDYTKRDKDFKRILKELNNE